MTWWHLPVGFAFGGGLGYGGGWIAKRWMEKPPARWQIYAVAGISALLAAYLAARHGLGGYFWQQALFIAILATASLVDLHDRIIPNELVLFGLGTGLVMLFALPYPEKSWIMGLGGAATGFGVLLLLALLVKGGMGLGDVKLAAVIGLFLGLKWVTMGLIFAFLSGGLVGGLLLLFKVVGRKDYIPFGPYLALGAAVTALFGPEIWTWYIGL